MPKPQKKAVFDIISVGDAVLDTFIPILEAQVSCDINKENCMISMSFADKIAVGKPQRIIGGNSANNAVGSSRLGMKTAFYTVLGNDAIGRDIRAMLAKEKVATEYVALQKGGETNTHFILMYQGERTILVNHALRPYRLPRLKDTKWMYLSSLSQNHGKLHGEILAWLSKRPTKLAFNPGTYQLKAGFAKLKPVLERTEVLFVNKEEAQRLVGAISDMKQLLTATKAVGPKIVVITDGQKGSYAYDGTAYWQCGITDTPSIERTGAGDSFATGFIAALNYGKEIPEALRWGTMNSGSVILKVGPQAGLLTKAQMASWLKKYPKLQAKPL